jgi:acyl-CoA thioester hydrolase
MVWRVSEPDFEARLSRYHVRVRFGETDLMGIVHHAAYLGYFEAGRVEYLRRRGIDALSWAAQGLHLPVVEARVKYRRTARFDDELVVETRVAKVSRVTVDFTYRILDLADQQLITEGNTLLACVGDGHKLRRIPADVVSKLLGPELSPRAPNEV